jgi:hypothetical protein
MPKRARPVLPPHIPPPNWDDPLRPRNPLVTRRWLLGGVGLIILASFAALYFAIGLLFWQGQWQLIFHPSHVVSRTPASSGIAYDEVRFDATETGQTRLTGWWIPGEAGPTGRPAILYLHEARGSLSDALPDLLALHSLGNDIFAFDPRGFGRSQWEKPSEHHWNQDAEAALYYLASVRHIGPSHLVVIGRGLGSTVAANLTLRRPDLQSLVMIDPQPPTLGLLRAPRWTHILPIRLLARDRFNPAKALASQSVNKLFLVSPNVPVPGYIARAAPPHAIEHSIDLTAPETMSALRQCIAATKHKDE